MTLADYNTLLLDKDDMVQKGYGWMLKAASEANDKHGNLLWLTAVITSLELEADPVATYSVCNDCNLCVDNCPSGALVEFILSDKRSK